MPENGQPRSASSDLSELIPRFPLSLPSYAPCNGDLAKSAERALIKACAQDDFQFAEDLEEKVEELRQELAGPCPSALEQLLVDRIVCCWIQVNHADAYVAVNQKRFTAEQGDYHQRRQDRAQRRFLQACKALAQVRKLEINVQVNIAEKQINVMHPVGDGSMTEAQGGGGEGLSRLRTYDPARHSSSSGSMSKPFR